MLYAPGLKTLDEVRRVAGALTKPLNVLAPLLKGVTVAELAGAGARRVSVGGALARAAVCAMMRAGTEMISQGSFGWTAGLASSADVQRRFSAQP